MGLCFKRQASRNFVVSAVRAPILSRTLGLVALAGSLLWIQHAHAQQAPTPRLTPRLQPRPSSPKPTAPEAPGAPASPAPEPTQPSQVPKQQEPATQPATSGAPALAAPTVTLPAGFYPPLLPAYRGLEPPAGYVARSRVNVPLLVAGGVTLAVSYGASIAYAASNDNVGGLAVPIFGPWIAMGRQKFDCSVSVDTSDPNADVQQGTDETTKCFAKQAQNVAVLAGLGIGQFVGTTLMLVGILDRKRQWLRADLAGVELQFAPQLSNPGLMAIGHF